MPLFVMVFSSEAKLPCSISNRGSLPNSRIAAATAAGFYVGFHVAIPLYLFVSVAWLGRQPVRKALMVAAGTSLAIYVVFELALAYSLHRGIFFQ